MSERFLRLNTRPEKESSFVPLYNNEPGWVRSALEVLEKNRESTDVTQQNGHTDSNATSKREPVMPHQSVQSSLAEPKSVVNCEPLATRPYFQEDSFSFLSSQTFWDTGVLEGPVPNGFYLITPGEIAKRHYDKFPTLKKILDDQINDLDVLIVDETFDRTLAKLKTLVSGLVKTIDCTPSVSIRKIAEVVADFFGGGPVLDAPTKPSAHNKALKQGKLGPTIHFLGNLKNGACRPRALLFKVLSDSIGLNTRLFAGLNAEASQSTSPSNHMAYDHLSNVINLPNGDEMFVDVMRRPGVLCRLSTRSLQLYHITGTGDSDSADSWDSPREPKSPLFAHPDVNPHVKAISPDNNDTLNMRMRARRRIAISGSSIPLQNVLMSPSSDPDIAGSRRRNRRRALSNENNQLSIASPENIKLRERFLRRPTDELGSLPSSPEQPLLPRTFQRVKSEGGSIPSSPENSMAKSRPLSTLSSTSKFTNDDFGFSPDHAFSNLKLGSVKSEDYDLANSSPENILGVDNFYHFASRPHVAAAGDLMMAREFPERSLPPRLHHSSGSKSCYNSPEASPLHPSMESPKISNEDMAFLKKEESDADSTKSRNYDQTGEDFKSPRPPVFTRNRKKLMTPGISDEVVKKVRAMNLAIKQNRERMMQETGNNNNGNSNKLNNNGDDIIHANTSVNGSNDNENGVGNDSKNATTSTNAVDHYQELENENNSRNLHHHQINTADSVQRDEKSDTVQNSLNFHKPPSPLSPFCDSDSSSFFNSRSSTMVGVCPMCRGTGFAENFRDDGSENLLRQLDRLGLDRPKNFNSLPNSWSTQMHSTGSLSMSLTEQSGREIVFPRATSMEGLENLVSAGYFTHSQNQSPVQPLVPNQSPSHVHGQANSIFPQNQPPISMEPRVQSFSSYPTPVQNQSQSENPSRSQPSNQLPLPILPFSDWVIDFSELKIGVRVGIGSFGEVFRGIWRGTEVAIKVLLEQDLTKENTEDFCNEISLLSRLRHPNVILFLGACTTPPHLSMITEYMHMGSLYRLIHTSGQGHKLSWRRRLKMLRDICRGMMCIQRMGIIHRDLKSANCLVDKHWTVKVCDLGLSTVKSSSDATWNQNRTAAGTPEWMAPELLRNEPFDFACDIFSLGIIMWELYTLRKPWDGYKPMEVAYTVAYQKARLDVPEGLLGKLIIDCWAENPSERPGYEEILTRLHECEFLQT